MLSQTFYRALPESAVVQQESDLGASTNGRQGREYLSQRLIGHPLWSDLGFWDQALVRCVMEQLPTVELPDAQVWHDLDDAARGELVTRFVSGARSWVLGRLA
jgi:hypothetical protein